MPHVDEPQRYVPLPAYPHLSDEESRVWQRYMANNPARFFQVYYDMRVGEGRNLPIDSDPTYQGAWWDLSRRRVDVIAEDQEAVYIIELKQTADFKAVMQAYGYAVLFRDNYPTDKLVVPVVLASHYNPDVKRIAKEIDVICWDDQTTYPLVGQ